MEAGLVNDSSLHHVLEKQTAARFIMKRKDNRAQLSFTGGGGGQFLAVQVRHVVNEGVEAYAIACKARLEQAECVGLARIKITSERFA